MSTVPNPQNYNHFIVSEIRQVHTTQYLHALCTLTYEVTRSQNVYKIFMADFVQGMQKINTVRHGPQA